MPIYMPKIKVRYSSISEILTIKEYWNLIDCEPFLAITWEPEFSQACKFCRMLMNHKNFYFTQIPDKTKDMIFLKSPKTLFWGHFWPFSVIFARWGFFLQVSEKTNELILRKLKDRWKDGQMEGRTDRTDGRMDGRTNRPYFIGPFQGNCQDKTQICSRQWELLNVIFYKFCSEGTSEIVWFLECL